MRAFVAVCVLLALATGCARTTYRHGGIAYSTKEAALAAAEKSKENMLARITPARSRVGGTMNLYMPDRQAIVEREVPKMGELRQEILDYLADGALIRYRGLYEAVLKRGSFDRVVLHATRGEEIPPKSGEFVLYVYQPGPGTSAWFFSSDSVKRERIHFDLSKPDASERVQYWLDSIDALAKVK